MKEGVVIVTNSFESFACAAEFIRLHTGSYGVKFSSSIDLIDDLEELIEKEKYREVNICCVYPPSFHKKSREWWKENDLNKIFHLLKKFPSLRIKWFWDEGRFFSFPDELLRSGRVVKSAPLVAYVQKNIQEDLKFLFEKLSIYYLIVRDEKLIEVSVEKAAEGVENLKDFVKEKGVMKVDPGRVSSCLVLDAKVTPTFKEIRRNLKKIAESDFNVLIYGESGTGKECLANQIHLLSRRSERPFFKINCGAISEDLALSELFGHVRGAFTGAESNKDGFFKQADGGTIFLDEINKCSKRVQGMLLRAIEYGEFYPVGGVKPVKTDVRMITALNKRVWEGKGKSIRFNDSGLLEDLYYRISEVKLRVPPVREWDIKDKLRLIHQLIYRLSEGELTIGVFSKGEIEMLLEYPWSRGNVREIRNTLLAYLTTGKLIFEEDFWKDEVLQITASGEEIEIDGLRLIFTPDLSMPPLEKLKKAIVEYLHRKGLTYAEIGEKLGISSVTVYKIRKGRK